MKEFINKYKNKNKEEEKNEEKIKNKRNNKQFYTDKEIKEQLDLQFDYDEDKKVEEVYDSFF